MKYEEKKLAIRRYLESHHFPGKKIPSERELAAMFDMNLGMVREVLRELETLSVIRKRKRQGNYLNSSVLRTRARLDDDCSFLAMIQAQGFAVREEKRLRMDPLPYDDDACQFLGGFPRRDLLCFEEIYYADGKPAIVSYYYCPKFYFGEVDWESIRNDSDALKEQIMLIYPDYDHSVIHLIPGLLPSFAADGLQLPEGTPSNLWKEVYYNHYDELAGISYNFLAPALIDLAFVRRRPLSERDFDDDDS